MRVTANMSADNSIYNLQLGRKRIDKLQETLTSSQNINKPSDDPLSSRLLMDVGDKIKVIDQYNANITKAQSWMKFNDSALNGMFDIMTQTRALLNTIGSGSSDASFRLSAHNQLVEMKKQVIDMANTQYGDQFIFGGANNLVAPFQQKTGNLTIASTTIDGINVTSLTAGMQISGTGIPANTTITTVTAGPPSSITLSQAATVTDTAGTLNFYAGDGTERQVEIAQGVSQPISATGDRLMQGIGVNPSYGTTDILQAFDDLIAAVGDYTTPSNTTALTAAQTSLDKSSSQVFNAINTNLSRMTRVDNISKMNENIKSTLTEITGKIQNPDMVKLGVQLNTEQNAFEASLSTTAKLVQMSLLDFM